jgi:prepilin-type N-terminal cleavage/methylation domain-containing protein
MSRDRGYTLIEILIALTIIGIIFGLGYASFREFARRQALGSAIRELTGDIRLAQSQSLAGKKPDASACNYPNSLESYSFRVINATSYAVDARCSGGSINVKTAKLLAGVTMTVPLVNPIEFKVLGEGTNLEDSVEIILSAYGTTRIVTVSPGGTVE